VIEAVSRRLGPAILERGTLRRRYREFVVDSETGEVESMRTREL
jgi:hypothetical protein